MVAISRRRLYAPTASLTGDRASNSGNVPALPTAVSTGLALSLLQWSRHRHRVNAKLLADMGKSFRIGEAAVGHHCAQFHKSRLGKEQSWQMLAGRDASAHGPLAIGQPAGPLACRPAGHRAMS
jgi:hypothetical protein